MSTEIYYFTGTGNSLVVARDIAKKIKGTLISVPSVMDKESIRTDADVIGIVFPVYYASLSGSGIPLIIESFVRKLENIGSKYLFTVCTHIGMPGDTIENLGIIVKSEGGELSAGFGAQMSIPYSAGDKIKHALFHRELEVDSHADNEKQQELFASWTGKLRLNSMLTFGVTTVEGKNGYGLA